MNSIRRARVAAATVVVAAVRASHPEHRTIVDAVRGRGAAAASSAFKRHALNGRERAVATAKAGSESA